MREDSFEALQTSALRPGSTVGKISPQAAKSTGRGSCGGTTYLSDRSEGSCEDEQIAVRQSASARRLWPRPQVHPAIGAWRTRLCRTVDQPGLVCDRRYRPVRDPEFRNRALG